MALITRDDLRSDLSKGGMDALVEYLRQLETRAFESNLLHVQDEKAQNTAGGTFTNGAWRTRDLTTEKTNEITGASLASNQVTLPAGDYWVEWSAPGFDCDRHKTKLVDVTNTVDLVLGTSEYSDSTGNVQCRSFGADRFTLSGTAALELQHRCETSRASNGLGVRSNMATEVYSILKIWKVA